MSSDHSLAADCPLPLSPAPSRLGRWRRRAARYTLVRLLEHLQYGSLRLNLPDGESFQFNGDAGAGPAAEVTIRDLRAITRLLSHGDIGFAESYLERQWDTPDLLTLIELAGRNEAALQAALGGGALSRLLNRLYHRSRHNSRQGSRRNIAFHYDLGNEFYQLWLDESMTYSSALFEHPEQDLELAQQAKYRRIAELAGLKPGAAVLEIGCGWGGFMEHAVSQWHSRVDGITLSKEQWQFANRRMQAHGCEDQAKAVLLDYRDTQGQYDAIVSIEMLEAVGEAHWPRYFETVFQRLKPGASAVV